MHSNKIEESYCSHSTKRSLTGRIADFFGMNDRFHMPQNDLINADSKSCIRSCWYCANIVKKIFGYLKQSKPRDIFSLKGRAMVQFII